MVECCDNVLDNSSSTTTSTADVKPEPARRGILHMVFRMTSDILLIGFILSTVFALVQNYNEPIKRAARKPEPFFSANSSVRDYWKGDVFTGFQDAAFYESSFFMFYAAWDRESQEARQEMEAVGQFFSESDVLIAAVNCWYPTSDCAKEFGGRNGTVNILPVFIFYPKLLSGIQYQGSSKAASIIRFLQRSRYPIAHVRSVQHLHQLQVDYESVLVGYLPSTSTVQIHPNHQDLLRTAYSLLEAVPEKPVSVGVVTSETLAKQLHLQVTQPVRLYTHNSTHVYPNKTLDGEKLLVWTVKHISPPASWLFMPGRKSRTLRRVLSGGSGSVLLLFGPRTELQEDKLFTILRQVSEEYVNCDTDTTGGLLNQVNRLKNPGASTRSENYCESPGSPSPPTPPSSPPTPTSSPPTPTSSPPTPTSSSSCSLRPWSYGAEEEAFPACSAYSAPCASNRTRCQERRRVQEHLQPGDPLVRLALQEVERMREKEREYRRPDLFSDIKSQPQSVRGLGCSSNRTLRFYRVDSDEYRSLLTGLGLETSPLPLPVILNLEDEAVYPPSQIRPGHFSEDLRGLIASWHGGLLQGKQGFRSTHTVSTLRYEEDPRLVDGTSDSSVITQVSATSFSELMSSDSDVLLFYTSSFCTHCTSSAFVFHAVKMYTQILTNLRFVMIDATKNDLNWEFTTLSYPTFLFFPKNRRDQSRAYPMDKPVSVGNLLSFIVSNLEPADSIKLGLYHCDTNCRRKLRLETVELTSSLTGQLRRLGPRVPSYLRSKLLRRLQHGKSILSILDTLGLSENTDQVHRLAYQEDFRKILNEKL